MTYIRTDFEFSKEILLETTLNILGSSGFDIESTDTHMENIMVCSNSILTHKKYRFKIRITSNCANTASHMAIESAKGNYNKDYQIIERLIRKIERKLYIQLSA